MVLLVHQMDKVELRACLKRSHFSCKTPYHQLNHSDSDPRLGRFGQGLKVFTEPPRAIEPAKRAFDDPTPLVKALSKLRTYIVHTRHVILNDGKRYCKGEAIATGFGE